MGTDRRIAEIAAAVVAGTGLWTSCGPAPDAATPTASAVSREGSHDRGGNPRGGNPRGGNPRGGNPRGGHGHGKEPTTLYVWAGDVARAAPDFLAVIDFDRKSPSYGRVLRTVPLPPPGNVGNEPHHCHTSADETILACGGLLSVLKGQNDIFFFDIRDARHPRFLRSTRAPNSSVTDEFLALPRKGKRLIFATIMAGQVVMLDISNPKKFRQLSAVSFGKDAGPHSVHLTHDGKRLVATDYFLDQDDFGKIHLDGDRQVRVLEVGDRDLRVDPAFRLLDFDTAFPTGPARPHGIGMK